MSLYTFARAIYRRLRQVPFLSPILERLRNLAVRGGRNRLLEATTLEQGRQLAGTRELVDSHMLLLDAHAQALAGLLQANAALEGRLARLENSLGGRLAQLESTLPQLSERVEFTRQEVLFEMRRALGTRPQASEQAPVQTRVINAAKLAAAGPRRLNVGCGHVVLVDMINVDTRELPGVDLVADAAHLPFEPGSVDEIYAAHLVEHFPARFVEDVLLPHWLGLLRPGGVLRLVAPDAAAMMEDYRSGAMSFEELALVTFGGQDYEGDFHYAMYAPDSLLALLGRSGLKEVEVVAQARKNGLCREMEVRGSKA